jgi:uncharacterized membrane protein
MATLAVLKFDSATGADQALQLQNLAGVGALGGAFWGSCSG